MGELSEPQQHPHLLRTMASEEVAQHSSACTTTNVQAQPPAMPNVDVTENSRMTISIQLQPNSYVMMITL